MKTPSSDLFQLIQSLSAPEQRYFRRFAGRHTAGEDNSYLRLFDLIIQQSEYDEAALKAQLANDPIAAHFAVTKRYLYGQILESLHHFHSAQSVEEAAKKDLHLAAVLIQKDLPAQAEKLLAKTKKRIRQYELYALLPELLQTERLLPGATEDSLKTWKSEWDDTLAMLANEAAFSAMAGAVSHWHLRKVSPAGGQLARALEEQGLGELLAGTVAPRTLRAQLDYYKARSTWHFMHGEPQEAYRLNRLHIALFEQHPQLLELYPRRYLMALNNLLIDQFQLQHFEELAGGIEKLKALPQRRAFHRIPNLEEKVFEQSALLELNACIARAQFPQMLPQLPAIADGLQRHGAKIALHNRLSIPYLLAYIYFENRRFEVALDCINSLLQYPRRDVMEELFRFAGLLNILIHFELGNEELAANLIPAARRQGLRSGRPFQVEALLFRFLQQLIQAPGERRRRNIYAQWHAALEPLRDDPAEQRAFNYFDFHRWTGWAR